MKTGNRIGGRGRPGPLHVQRPPQSLVECYVQAARPHQLPPPPPLVNSSPTRAQGGSRICHLPPQTEPSEAATARAPLSETTE